jgi:hypothetical protein
VVFHTVLIQIELGQVLSLVSTIATEGERLQKGEEDEFGYFHQVGGMVFQKGVVPESNLFNSTPDYNRWA